MVVGLDVWMFRKEGGGRVAVRMDVSVGEWWLGGCVDCCR